MPTTQTDNAVNQIADAFADVSLGNGVSLREADVIDAYGTEDERASAREQDELHDCERISDEDIETHSSAYGQKTQPTSKRRKTLHFEKPDYCISMT